MSAQGQTTPDVSGWSCYTASPSDSLELFEQVRGVCPLAQSDEHDGFHMLVDWRDVRLAMSDYKTFSSQPQVLRPMLPRKPIPGLEMDPPQHREWRAIYNQAVKRLDHTNMDAFIRGQIRRHLESISQKEVNDIVSGLCEPLPAEVICKLMGISDAQTIAEVRRTAIAMFAAQGDPVSFGLRQDEFGSVAVGEIYARKQEPKDDFLTYLAGVQVEGRSLVYDDYVVLLAAFLGAGHHSTTSAMASLIWAVFSRPTLRDRLLEDRSLIAPTIEETLRLHPPFFGFFRRTTRAVDVRGTSLPSGQDVYCGWAAANRDPEIFDHPEEFDIDRTNLRHMSFGFGIHSCPGAPLARMELTILLDELLNLTPGLEPVDGPPEFVFGGGDYAFIPELRVRFHQPFYQEQKS